MRVLGIETSCDETAVAVVEASADDRPVGRILANVVYSQLTEHRRFGGVVPEIAARAHLERIDGLVEQALAEAKLGLGDLDGIAATGGPGLIGGVMVGVMLLVSGGHCQLLTVRGPGDFTRLGTTIDDAVGECFDKTAKLLGLGFPGGPAVERAAKGGDTARFKLPRPMWRKPGCDFSFSGLKTAVRLMAESLPKNDPQAIADLCASFQRTVGDVLVDRCGNALARAPSDTLVVAGGVAANTYLRGRLEGLGVRLVAPPIKFCTDNGAMIAWAGIERLRRGMVDALDFAPRPRWPLAAAAGEGT